jgi:predicted ATPase/signal transduction histidine kinase
MSQIAESRFEEMAPFEGASPGRSVLFRSGDNALYRQWPGSDRAPDLLVLAEAEAGARDKRLEHEFSLAAELDSEWAARPLRLSRQAAESVLWLEDPGGAPADQLVGQHLDTARFLNLAIAVTEAVGGLHSHGLIHRDIKPANILADLDGRKAWLTGFGVASRLGREHQAPEPPNMIAGTLAYMAPEQTGRMNRVTDSRGDLYALGVTFYELLTGALPFLASDPIELIHCHIAREPPSAASHGAPGQLSAIVAKLLAKNGEERYQTAAGLAADLRRCLVAIDARGRIGRFRLGLGDAPDRFSIPERLYGRDREVATLLAAFDQVVADGEPRLVLVSGASGIGKSSVVNELHKVIVLPRGIFMSGKFDQRLRDVPYSTIAQAFQELIGQLLKGTPAEIEHWREAVLEAVGPNGALLTELIPDLVRMIGPQRAAPQLPAFDTQVRFQLVFQRFLGVFARPEHPLVMFIDDLQWLDSATLQLIEQIMSHPETRRLLFVGAYRDNEVGPDHALLRTIAALEQSGRRVDQLVLGPISLGDITQLVAGALRCPRTRARRLAELVLRKTGGNPLFAVQFLTALAEEGLIRLDSGPGAWSWDIEELAAKGEYADDLVDLIVGRLRRLPARSQDALKMLACLGADVDFAILKRVLEAPEADIQESLRPAVQSGAIVSRGGAYRFTHDRVQEAAYALIPGDLRRVLHRQVATRLLDERRDEEIAEDIFDVVNQLNLGLSPGATAHEKRRIARLNLQAGLRAKAATAYASACSYFAFGRATLGQEGWADTYPLALKLLSEQAECELLRSNLDLSAELIEQLISRSQSKAERTDAFALQITLQLLQADMPLAVRTALECLKMFGMTFPARPTADDVRGEYEDLQRAIGSRPIESLRGLPLTEDPEIRALGGLLITLTMNAYYVDEHLFDMLVCRMVKISVDHGHNEFCTVAFGGLGMILGPRFGRYEDGELFGRLSIALSERLHDGPHRVGAYQVHQLTALWVRPIDEALRSLDAADRAALETGEVVFACYSAEQRITNLLARGDTLDQVQPRLTDALAFVRDKRCTHIVDILSAMEAFIAALRGRPTESDEASLLRTRLPIVQCFYWVLQLQLRYLLDGPSTALEAADRVKPLLWSARCHIQSASFRFYHALALAAAIRADPKRGHDALLRDLDEELAAVRKLAGNSPHTYEHKRLLVEAEVMAMAGHEFEALQLYERAIRLAGENGFLQDEAIACELAAEFCERSGLDRMARDYWRQARNGYARWGAMAKVAQLDERHPEAAPEVRPSRLPTIEAPVEHLDLATVFRMSQAVAGQVVLDRVIETVLELVVEHTGADRGLLIVPHQDDLWIEAQATTRADAVNIGFVRAGWKASDGPASIFQHVRRSLQPVILNDTRAASPFSSDAYLRESRVRSLFCLPLVNQGELAALLYLENRLAADVFTPARSGVLRLLSSQIAISLQNARLYANLIAENSERQKAEEALRESQAEVMRVMRLTTIGELVASITHEITQPLTAIASNGRASMNWLDRDPPDVDRARNALQRVDRDVQHARDIIQSLRALVTKSGPNRAWVKIDKVVDEALALVANQLRNRDVRLVADINGEVPPIFADRVQLQQVVLNLILNAAEAMDAAEAPRVLTIASSRTSDGGVYVSVADTGPGIDPDTAGRVFDSFFSTKSNGMGMGLAICRSIIEAHEGRIWVEPNTPHGAIFQFTVPPGNERPQQADERHE